MSRHLDSQSNSSISMPKPYSTMTFKNYRNMWQRPFIFYADFECSIIPNKDPNTIAKHVANSAMFYFVCAYDSSRNKLYTFEGPNCVAEMIVKLRKISWDCANE